MADLPPFTRSDWESAVGLLPATAIRARLAALEARSEAQEARLNAIEAWHRAQDEGRGTRGEGRGDRDRSASLAARPSSLAPEDAGPQLTVTSPNGAWLLRQPSALARSYRWLPAGTRLAALGIEFDGAHRYVHVRDADGAEGYVASDQVEERP